MLKYFNFSNVVTGLVTVLLLRVFWWFGFEDFLSFLYVIIPSEYKVLIDSLFYGTFALFLKLGFRGIIEDIMTKFNMPLYMGMDNPDSNSGSREDSEPASKVPKHSYSEGIGGSTSNTDSVSSNPHPNVPSSPNCDPSSNSGPSSNSDLLSEKGLPIKSVKPLEGVSRSTQKLDSVYDRQIEKLSAELSQLNLKLSTETDESSIENLRDAIDSTHDQLTFVQTAKLETIRNIQQGGSTYTRTNTTLAENSDSSKRKFSEDFKE